MCIAWESITTAPTSATATAMIMHVEGDESHLLPGPVCWDNALGAWVSECSGEPVKLDPDGEYYWCHEEDITE
jgi:hypothetical protein